MSFYKEVPGRKTTLESTLKFDIEPKVGSTNPVTSDGVKGAIDGAVGDASEALQQQIDDIAEKAGSGYIPKGEATVATLNALSGQENGELYTMTDAGTLTDGSLAVVVGDTVAWDATNSVWYKAMDYAPRQYGTNEVHNLPTSITAFRTGDVIAVDGPSGTAKMAKDSLLAITAENAHDINTYTTIQEIKEIAGDVFSLNNGKVMDTLELLVLDKYGYKNFSSLSSTAINTNRIYFITEKPTDGKCVGIFFKSIGNYEVRIYKVKSDLSGSGDTTEQITTYTPSTLYNGKNVFIKFPSEVILDEDEYIGVSWCFGYGSASGHNMYEVNSSVTNNYSLAFNVVGKIKTKFEELQEEIDKRPLEYKSEYYTDQGGATSIAGGGIFILYANEPITGTTKIEAKLKSFTGSTLFYVFEKNSNTLSCISKSSIDVDGKVLVDSLDDTKEYVVGVGGGGEKYKFTTNPAGYKMYQMASNSYNVGDTATMPTASYDMVLDADVYKYVQINYEWLDETVKRLDAEFPIIFNKDVVIVAKDGQGDFTSINAAILGTSYATKNNPVTIIVYPGVYEEVVNIYGSSKYSIVGVNRDKCIVVDHTGIYNNCPLRIEGNAYVANLTLISDHSATADFVEGGTMKYNPSYGLHIDDRHDDDDDDYRITIFNCRVVSHQNPAVGIGLDKNQVVELNQCEFISSWDDDVKNASIPSALWGAKPDGGAVFWHALYPAGKYPISGASGYQQLVVKDCTIKANRNNTVVMESGSSTDEDCEVTMIGNACYSETNGRTWVIKSGMSPMPISSGNNVEGMNFV